MTLNIKVRVPPAAAVAALTDGGVDPLLARIYAARGIVSPQQLATGTGGLLPPERMHNLERMAALLADAIAAGKKLLIVADYDADGATACAVGIRALRAFGARVDYLVPNRFEYGYGLTPEIVELAHREKNPDLLITVDNGIASVDGVATANRLGMRVLVTDHHLPGAQLPDALCIINPNQAGCGFPSKNLAGVGVMFYLMLALRAELRKRGAFDGKTGPNLSALLDLVALGTVADVVKLDDNNRILVQQGLQRMRAGRTWPGIAALMKVAGRDPAKTSTYDLGFVLGPRLNAAGRLEDMALGIECLITDDVATAERCASELDRINRERRLIENDMHADALAVLGQLPQTDSYSLSLFDAGWHPGVIGILASRIRERLHRPVIAFAPGSNGEIKGSGRSIPALHLRDALDLVAKRDPGLLLKFGGHAAAAGLTLRAGDFERFRDAFEAAACELLSPADLERVIETDGALAPELMTLENAALLERVVWGQGFPPPTFDGEFVVVRQRVVGERHMKLRVACGGREFDAMLFARAEPLPPRVRTVYRLASNEYNGQRSVQLTIEQWEAL
ncbi:MAG TPA: single-stranded-DNA-specific exonuclease RecJ [Burkholderiales bacterium]|nr:single-stranded-DNA-specific exonuclease RecJ [Burkholderiales bacterium]